VVVVASVAALFMAGSWFYQHVSAIFAQGFQIDPRALDSPNLLPVLFAKFTVESFLVMLPLFLLTVVAAFIGCTTTGGFNFSWKAAAPKPDKLNPISGIKRMFGLNALMELGKAILKFSLVVIVLFLMMSYQMPDYLKLSSMPMEPAMGLAGRLLGELFLAVACSLILIAFIDVPFQKHQYWERMKMTKQDVKDEMKDIEGRPEVKAQIRRRQREMAANRMMQKVQDADVVVTNPEHFAVALSYDPAGDGAPMVVAMGADHLAFRIREEAKRCGVEIFSAPPLARALYFTSELDRPIHQDLYFAVAQVIAYVFGLNTTRPDGTSPARPTPKVPAAMQFDADGKPVTL
jgi:flagellar biosynthetic protein FlhB